MMGSIFEIYYFKRRKSVPKRCDQMMSIPFWDTINLPAIIHMRNFQIMTFVMVTTLHRLASIILCFGL